MPDDLFAPDIDAVGEPISFIPSKIQKACVAGGNGDATALIINVAVPGGSISLGFERNSVLALVELLKQIKRQVPQLFHDPENG